MKLYLNIILITLFITSTSASCFGSSVAEKSSSEQASTLSERIVKDDLLDLISEDKKANDNCMRLAKKVLDRVYECERRAVKCTDVITKYGFSYPINPEILAHVMKLSRGKKVLEIGAARGENSLFMGLAGAQEVYVNDMEHGELAALKKNIQRLPDNLQNTFHIIPGDCLKVFQDTRYTEQFDVIYARNIFHFFLGEKRAQFIALINRLLKPGGHVILTVNSAAQYSDIEIVAQHPESYVFKYRTLMYRDKRGNQQITGELSEVPDITHINPLDYNYTPIVKFTTYNIVYCDGFKDLSQKFQEIVKDQANELADKYTLPQLIVNNSTIDYHIFYLVFYTKHTIQEPFSTTNLEIENMVATDVKGHATENKTEEFFLTVILKKSALGGEGRQHKPSEKNKIQSTNKLCGACNKTGTKLCSRCKNAYYCSAACQRKAWSDHKKVCKKK